MKLLEGRKAKFSMRQRDKCCHPVWLAWANGLYLKELCDYRWECEWESSLCPKFNAQAVVLWLLLQLMGTMVSWTSALSLATLRSYSDQWIWISMYPLVMPFPCLILRRPSSWSFTSTFTERKDGFVWLRHWTGTQGVWDQFLSLQHTSCMT